MTEANSEWPQDKYLVDAFGLRPSFEHGLQDVIISLLKSQQLPKMTRSGGQRLHKKIKHENVNPDKLRRLRSILFQKGFSKTNP